MKTPKKLIKFLIFFKVESINFNKGTFIKLSWTLAYCTVHVQTISLFFTLLIREIFLFNHEKN